MTVEKSCQHVITTPVTACSVALLIIFYPTRKTNGTIICSHNHSLHLKQDRRIIAFCYRSVESFDTTWRDIRQFVYHTTHKFNRLNYTYARGFVFLTWSAATGCVNLRYWLNHLTSDVRKSTERTNVSTDLCKATLLMQKRLSVILHLIGWSIGRYGGEEKEW